MMRRGLVLLTWIAISLGYAAGGTTVLAQRRAVMKKTPAVGTSTRIKNVFWQPNQLKQGSVAFFTVEVEGVPLRVSGTWIGKTLTFNKSENPKIWYALAGADLETAPGSYDLAVSAVLPGGRVARAMKPVELASANFKEGTVEVPDNFVNPDADEKRQIAKDEVLKSRAYSRATPKTLWSGDFVKPVPVAGTETFGESRILNEEKTSTHRGTDFPVKEGTTVAASNAGTVVLASEMFYEGNCVIVDHGEKLFTIYMHLSKMDVKAGDKLTKGAKIGLSGATGRVTGPHMHFGVRWNGAYLDPLQLLALTLPKTASTPVTPAARSRGRR